MYVDKSLSAFSDSTCQQACDVEREFVCRSFTFLSQVGNYSVSFSLSSDLKKILRAGKIIILQIIEHYILKLFLLEGIKFNRVEHMKTAFFLPTLFTEVVLKKKLALF
jgi:hypothetical protein